MQSTTKIVKDFSSVCLICDSALSVSTSSNIFVTCMPQNGELLANFVVKILRSPATALGGSHMCRRCYALFETLERAERTANEARGEIFRVYGEKNCREGEKIDAAETSEREEIVDDRRSEEIRELRLPRDDESVVFARTNDSSDDNEAKVSDFVEAAVAGARNDDDNDITRLTTSDRCLLEDLVVISQAQRKNSAVDAANTVYENSMEFAKNFQQPSLNFNVKSDEKLSTISSSGGGGCEISDETTEKKFKEIGSWRSGRISKYSQKPLKYSCTSCDKKWRTSAELRTHAKSHSSLRPYMCEICGQSYKHKHALEIHVGMHNGVSPYRCNVCEKFFTQKGALMRHLPMHTGETPYQCELCGKRFVHHTSYNMHALSHTGKKSYRCHVCDLSLLSTSHLKRHMRVHTGEKPYSCPLCGKSFAERYNLFAHQKIHDPAEIMAKAAKKMPFKCKSCDEHFDKKQKLEDHEIEHNSNDTTNQRKWIGHTIDVNSSSNVDITRTSDVITIDDTWRENDYEKFTTSHIELRSYQGQ